MLRNHRAAICGLALIGAMSLSATAAPHNEISDAGQTPGSAQIVNGSGTLDSITGAFFGTGDSDVYVIRISNPATFSALTSSTIGGADHQIQLFGLNGAGIAFNDDNPGNTTDFTSALPAGDPLYAGLTPGNYLLGISQFDNDAFINPNPLLQDDYVFPFNSGGASRSVSGPNSGSVGVPFIDYDTTFGPVDPDLGQYTITLSGAAFVPEPAALGLIAAASFMALRRRA